MNVHYYSDAITVNCCSGTVQMLWVGSLEKCCFQLLTEAGRWRRRPDTSWQAVPGTCGRHWKSPVAECGSASWRHDECRRACRSESTLSIYFSGQLKCLGEVRRCQCAIKTSPVRVLHRLCWKCNCSCILSRLRNKSSKVYKMLSVLNKIMLKIIWFCFFCGHRVGKAQLKQYFTDKTVKDISTRLGWQLLIGDPLHLNIFWRSTVKGQDHRVGVGEHLYTVASIVEIP